MFPKALIQAADSACELKSRFDLPKSQGGMWSTNGKDWDLKTHG